MSQGVVFGRLDLDRAALRQLALARAALDLFRRIEAEIGPARALVRELADAEHLGLQRSADRVQQVSQGRMVGTAPPSPRRCRGCARDRRNMLRPPRSFFRSFRPLLICGEARRDSQARVRIHRDVDGSLARCGVAEISVRHAPQHLREATAAPGVSQSTFTLRHARLTTSLLTAPRKSPNSARFTRRVLVPDRYTEAISASAFLVSRW